VLSGRLATARNKVLFQRGLSDVAFDRLYGSYNTAWAMLHKLKQVMLEREQEKPLDGRIEMDDAYLGGARSGGKRGRGSPGKTPFVAAVETTADGKSSGACGGSRRRSSKR
jgi:hypothetical protein